MSQPQSENDQEKLFDLHFLSGNLGNDESLRRQIIQVFLSTSGEIIRQMEEKLLAGDTDDYRKLAHKIYPSLKLLGMEWAANTINLISAALIEGADTLSQLPVFQAFRAKMEKCFTELQAWS